MIIDQVPNLDANHLIVFFIVGVEKNLTSAAEKLHLSQPAITYHIKCLEESIEQKLIVFKKQKSILTPAGEGIFQYCAEIYQQMVNLDGFVEFLKESRLRVGVAPHYVPIIAPILKNIRDERRSDFQLIIEAGNTLEMVENVVDSRLDLVLGQDIDYGHKILKKINVSTPERLVCFASYTHPLCNQDCVEWKDLRNYPVVTGPVTTAMLNMASEKFDTNFHIDTHLMNTEVSSVELSKKLVEDGECISFCFINDIEKELSEGKLKILPMMESLMITPSIILRRDTYMHPIITNFISMVRKSFKENASKNHLPV